MGEPALTKATDLAEGNLGAFQWDATHHNDTLNYSNQDMTVEWDPTFARYKGKYPPIWVPVATRSLLHSGDFRWDFVVDEMADAQIGLGFMLMWDIGPDWGFFGYLGASTTAWAYDPSSGDVVVNTASIEGGLPTIADRHRGVVSVSASLPRHGQGSACFLVNGKSSRPIPLVKSAVITPAACLLSTTQRVTLSNLRQL